MKLTITQEHIDRALAAQRSATYDVCRECVIAQAAREIWPLALVNYNYIWSETGISSTKHARLSDSTRMYLLDFDNGVTVEPTTLELIKL